MGSHFKYLLILHILLLFYSFGNVCSKFAAEQPFFSLAFIAWYFGMLAIMAVYALGWQQILKRMPLTSAFSNRAITIVWGIVWGLVFFSEPVTSGKVVGAIIIIVGVVLFAHADRTNVSNEENPVEKVESADSLGSAPEKDMAHE